MKKLLISILKFALSLGLGALLVWLAVRKLTPEDINEMKAAFARANWFWLFMGTAIGMLSNFVRAERWNMLLRSLGYKAKFGNVAAAVYVMYVGNIAFPRLGEISRCGVVFKTDGVPIEKSIGTMVLERIVDMLTLLTVGFLLFFVQHDLLFSVFEKYLIVPIQAKLQSTGNTSFYVQIAVLLLIPVLGFFIYKKAAKLPLVGVVLQKAKGMLSGLIAIRNVENPWLFLCYSILVWVMYLGMGYCNFMAFAETAHLGVGAAMAILFFGTFAFIATQGGVGAYPLITREILLLYGVSANIGYAWGWIAWTAQTLMVILSGLIAMAYLSFQKKKA